MTTYFPFKPVIGQPFQFEPTLDNNPYTGLVTWSLFGKRWMLNLSTSDGTLIVTRAIVGSPDGVNIQDILWDHGIVTVQTVGDHPFILYSTIPLTITGSTPDILNGIHLCFITARDQFTFNLPTNPEPHRSFGQVFSNIDLVKYYFNTSTLIYRENSQQFEVTP